MVEFFQNGLGPLTTVEPQLAAALRDVLTHPGSLVRAMVCYQTGIEMGLPADAASALGCGIEYLHTASLIFDDFPAMDDAWLRRGAVCLHIAHGEGIATLAALALINRGYALLWQGIQHASLSRRLLAGEWIESKLGVQGVTGGQAWDLRGWSGGQTAAEV